MHNRHPEPLYPLMVSLSNHMSRAPFNPAQTLRQAQGERGTRVLALFRGFAKVSIKGEGVRGPFSPPWRPLRNRHSGENRNPEGSTPLTLSVSKGLSGVEGWFDKLTMSGYAKVSTMGEG